MIKTFMLIFLGCIAIAFLGALGENMLRYGRKNGIVKDISKDDDNGEDNMKETEKIKALIKPVGEKPYFTEIENTLECLQGIVGGYIEAVALADDMVIICDEEGIIKNSRYNVTVCGVQFFGTVIVCGVKGDEFSDIPLSEDNARRLFCSMFAKKGD